MLSFAVVNILVKYAYLLCSLHKITVNVSMESNQFLAVYIPSSIYRQHLSTLPLHSTSKPMFTVVLVPVTVVLPQEPLVAELAHVLHLPDVSGLDVVPHVVPPDKPPSAVLARVGEQPRVVDLVQLQLLWRAECLLTLVALVGFFPGVNPLVSDQAVVVVEELHAVLALQVTLGVHLPFVRL